MNIIECLLIRKTGIYLHALVIIVECYDMTASYLAMHVVRLFFIPYTCACVNFGIAVLVFICLTLPSPKSISFADLSLRRTTKFPGSTS